MTTQAVATQQPQSQGTAGTVVATVGCAALGLVVAGPVGAFVGGGVGALLASSGSGRSRQLSPPLGITNIQLPRDGMGERQGVTYFTVELTHGTRGTWRVTRRYSEFYKLRKFLRVRYPFPRKHWFGCRGLQLEARRQGLEAWLSYVVLRYANAGVPTWAEPSLVSFLERASSPVSAPQLEQAPPDTLPVVVPAGVVAGQTLRVASPDGSSFVISVPQGAAAGSVLHVRRPSPPESAPAAAAAVPEPPAQGKGQGTEGGQPMMLNISVPPGIQPGQLLGVKVPDGRELTLEVPANAGSELQLEFDPVAGRLSVVPGPEAKGGEGAGSSEVFAVPIPAGSQPGQLIHVQVPDGRHLPVTVPASKLPGDQFMVRFDPSTGHLVAL